jgi:osmoprotectant transport system ATP-binding protein
MIRFDRVSKLYPAAPQPAVNQISLAVNRGELLVLLGESGCGKTTTLKMVNRLVEPTSGQITIDGRAVRDHEPAELRRTIGYVFQGVGLFPHMTVAENVGITPQLLGWTADRVASRVEELLTLVRLAPAEFADRLPRALSGGQQQRVGFARALAASPAVMLLDEPFGALDPLTRDALQQDFRTIQRQLELTAILVTHDVNEALLLADRIAVMLGGEILQIGTARELLATPAHDYVSSLLEMPKRQAELIDTYLHGSGAA